MKISISKFAWRRAAGMVIPILLGLLAAALHPRFDAQERQTWDARFVHRGPRQTSGRVVLVNIDDPTVEYEKWRDEPMVIWGSHYAAAVRNLKKAGAAAVGWDMMQLVSTEGLARKLKVALPFDQDFAQALGEAGNVVLVVIRRQGRWVHSTDQLLWANGIENVGAANFAEGDSKQGTNADRDGVARGFRPIWGEGTADDSRVSSLGLRLVEKLQGRFAIRKGRELDLGDLKIPLHRNGTILINYCGPKGTLPSCSLSDIAEGRMPAGIDFRGKVVLIGESFTGTQDFHLTPFSRGADAAQQYMNGVEVWGNAVDTLLQRRFLRATEVPTGRLLLFALALVTGAIFLSARQWVGAVAAVALMVGWYGACEWAFRAHDYLLLMFTPMCLIPANYFTIIAYRFFAEEREKRKIQGMWGRYCSKTVVEHLLKHPEDQGLGGKRTTVTVLFSDIRGFTTMSDKMPAASVVQTLNEYFTEMTGIVVKHGGIVDKYIGDAIMAVWGAPVPCSDGPARAARTAVEMVQALEALNARWQARASKEGAEEGGGRPARLAIGVGINTGDVVAGNIGSEHKYDFTVIGDTVNVASRFESLTKEFKVPILLGEATWRELGPEFDKRLVGRTAVRGKEALMDVYTVDGVVADAAAAPVGETPAGPAR